MLCVQMRCPLLSRTLRLVFLLVSPTDLVPRLSYTMSSVTVPTDTRSTDSAVSVVNAGDSDKPEAHTIRTEERRCMNLLVTSVPTDTSTHSYRRHDPSRGYTNW